MITRRTAAKQAFAAIVGIACGVPWVGKQARAQTHWPETVHFIEVPGQWIDGTCTWHRWRLSDTTRPEAQEIADRHNGKVVGYLNKHRKFVELP